MTFRPPLPESFFFVVNKSAVNDCVFHNLLNRLNDVGFLFLREPR